MKLPRKEYIREHTRLIDTLQRPTPAKLRLEIREQGKDLKEAREKKR